MLNTMVIFIFPLRLSFNKKGLILVLAKSRDTRGKYKALITGLVIEAERSKANAEAWQRQAMLARRYNNGPSLISTVLLLTYQKRTNSTPRPVKVTLSSAATVQQILGKSRKLRTSQYDSVYLTPDRTAEQRAEHRQLVEQLKKKGKDEPGRHHYIKAGQIFSTELKNQDDVLK
jgi:hypothetical protein